MRPLTTPVRGWMLWDDIANKAGMLMKHIAGPATLTALLLSSTAVQADVTAEEVWTGIESYYADTGYAVTTESTEKQGDTLVVSGVTLSNELPEVTASINVGEMRFKELGDGRVEMTFAESIPMTVMSKPATGEAVETQITMTQTGLSVIVSGSAEDTTYDYTAPEFAMAMGGMSVDGAEVPLSLNVKATGNSGMMRMQSVGDRKMVQEMRTEKVDFSMSAEDPGGKGRFSTSGSFAELDGTANMIMPEGVDMKDMNAAIQAGWAVDGVFSFSGGGYVMDFAEGEETMHAESTMGAGSFLLDMSSSGLSYGVTGDDTKMSMQVSSFPMPIDLSVAQSAFNLTLPVTKSDDAQPFGMLMKFVDLEVSEGLWGIFDPAAQLPRDPATVIVDLSGAAKMLVNILDPEEAETLGATPPGSLEALDLNELKVSAVGAELTGTGAVTFDNSAGMPKPLGAVDLQLIGGNGLIDKLVAMGFVPEDQAMGARMMLGLFAVPSGEDTLTSKIEFKEDGGVYANGQRVQ